MKIKKDFEEYLDVTRYGTLINDTELNDNKREYFVRVKLMMYCFKLYYITMVNGEVVDFRKTSQN